MLVSELISWCNSIYEPDETSDFEITDDRWILFFNECISDIRPYTNIYVTATTDLVEGTEEYALPSDLDVMHELYICTDTSATPLIYAEMTRVKEETTLGSNEYILWDKTFTIAEPDETIEDGLKLYYWRKATDIEEVTETIELDDPYILGYYALGQVELADRQQDYSVHYERYKDKMLKLKSKIGFDLYELESRW